MFNEISCKTATVTGNHWIGHVTVILKHWEYHMINDSISNDDKIKMGHWVLQSIITAFSKEYELLFQPTDIIISFME